MVYRRLMAALAATGVVGGAHVPDASAKAPVGRFTVIQNSNGVVVYDATLNRTWQRATGMKDCTWATAKNYCSGLQLQGGGWRLPDLRELQSLVDFKEPPPTIDKSAFPDTPVDMLWTSTAYQPAATGLRWAVHFNYGSSLQQSMNNPRAVRCVR